MGAPTLLWVWVLAACGVWGAPSYAQGVGDCSVATTVTQARRVVSQDENVLADDVVALPDHLPLAWRNEQIRIRYELDVSACASVDSASLSLFRVGAPFSASANGQSLQPLLTPGYWGSIAGFGKSWFTAQAHTFNGRVPILFALTPGTAKVQIALLTLTFIPAGLTVVQIGPTNAMVPITADDIRSVVAYADAVAGVMLVLALMAVALWLQRRHYIGFLWMALACASWSIRALAYFDNNVYLRPMWFEQANPFNVLLTAVLLCAATLASMVAPRPAMGPTPTRDWRLRPRWMLAFALASSSAGFLAAQALGQGAVLARVYAACWALLLSLLAIWWLWSGRLRLRRWYWVSAIAGYLGLVGSAIHDMGLVTGAVAPTGPSYLFWGFAMLLVVYAVIAGDYIIAMLGRAENINEELERRIATKSTEVEHSYAQLRMTEMAGARASARQHERERLLRDMHDGLGAQLMMVLRGVERAALSPQQIAELLQEGVDELRMLMDSADMGSDLSIALGAWRNRWDTRLEAAGVQLHWRLDDSLDALRLDGDVLLQIMRILQEAATNVVKHAGARNMYLDARLHVSAENSTLEILSRDDGCGLDAHQAGPGRRGLKNMRHRAAQIGAQLDVTSIASPASGCQVLLQLQIHPAPARPERRRHPRLPEPEPSNFSVLS